MDRAPDFECFVPGIPRPQGSKTRNGNGSMREASKYVKGWRTTVQVAAGVRLRTTWCDRHHLPGCVSCSRPLDGPLMLGVEFLFTRPQAHFYKRKTGPRSWDMVLRPLGPQAPIYMTGKPDKDKLVRAVGDALVVAGVVLDDSLFVKDHESGCKRYANPGEQPGAWIRIWRL